LAAVWLNPRSYDDALAAKLRQAEGQEAAFLKTFLSLWKAAGDGVALTLALGADLEVGPGAAGPARGRAARGAHGFFDEAATASDAWGRFPDDALLAAGARTGPCPLRRAAGRLPDQGWGRRACGST